MYPTIEPFRTGYLKVSDLHEIYFEEVGNPAGFPILFLHGGPGGGLSPESRRFFDPQFYRVILFDQRGAGRSRPRAEVRENTTWDLVADMEKLRELLHLERWALFGGSWGSTLALAYASQHPHRVTRMVLRGIFLCRNQDLQWFYQAGAHHIYPDLWKNYVTLIPNEERGDLISAFHRRIMDPRPEVHLPAARAWSQWEGGTVKLINEFPFLHDFNDDSFCLTFARIESHYFVNRAFFPHEDYLLDQVPKLRSIPTTIIHGRYDVVCPVSNAWALHERWPEADLRIIPAAGHSALDPAITTALINATDEIRDQEQQPR